MHWPANSPITSKKMCSQLYAISSTRQDTYVDLNPDAMPDAMVTPHIRMPTTNHSDVTNRY